MKRDHYIKPNWPAPPGVQAFTTTRLKGFSQAPYDHFNLAHHVGEAEAVVRQNREQLRQELSLPSEPVWLNQTHSAIAISLDDPGDSVTADAAYTRESGKVCAVLTADCLPLLVTHQKGHTAAAIHAGWRGLLAGVIDQTLLALKENPSELLVWLGPAIGPQAFEVGPEVREAYLKRHPDYARAFKPHKDRWLANIYDLAKICLNHLNVHAIYGGTDCTYQNPQFYSYRRDQGQTGRMASLIWLS